jgi:hypothetical protein
LARRIVEARDAWFLAPWSEAGVLPAAVVDG